MRVPFCVSSGVALARSGKTTKASTRPVGIKHVIEAL